MSTTPTIPLNQWSHLAAVFNDAANTYTLYLNGTAIRRPTRPTAPVPNTQALVFGQSACSSCGGERWRGLLDDIRIYNRALTATEIQTDLATAVNVLTSTTLPPGVVEPAATARLLSGSPSPLHGPAGARTGLPRADRRA